MTAPVYITIKEAVTSLPVKVSERRFRKAAVRLKKNVLTGRQMMIRPEHVQEVLEGLCSGSSNGDGKKPNARTGRSKARAPTGSSTERALERIAALKQKPLLSDAKPR